MIAPGLRKQFPTFYHNHPFFFEWFQKKIHVFARSFILFIFFLLIGLQVRTQCNILHKRWKCIDSNLEVESWKISDSFILNAFLKFFIFSFLVTMRGLAWVWVNWIAGLTDKELKFRTGITLGTSSDWFLPFHVFIPRCSRNSSGECPYPWIQENSSISGRAPEMRDSVLMNYWDSFLVTLPSIFSETCVTYGSLIVGTNVFRDWPFLRCSSCAFLEMAASFRLILNVAIFLKGKMLESGDDWSIFWVSTKL